MRLFLLLLALLVAAPVWAAPPTTPANQWTGCSSSATAWEVVADGVDRRPSGGLLILYLRERLAMLRHLAAGGALDRQQQDGVERFVLA